MYYHIPQGWGKRTSKQNREEKDMLVKTGKSHGVLMYHNGDPIGWCQFGPREELPRIDRMRKYRASEEEDFWRITCFFIDKRYRGKGVAREALRAALRVMKQDGVKLVEAYPIDVGQKRYSSSQMWFGSLKLFEEFGFTKVGNLGKNQPIVRKEL